MRAAIVAVVFLFALWAPSEAAAPGALTQLSGTAGCIAESGDGVTCADGHGLGAPFDIKVTPDGLNAYGISYNTDAVTAFSRDPATGVLTQLSGTDGCISEDGGGGCSDGHGLDQPLTLTISPD